MVEYKQYRLSMDIDATKCLRVSTLNEDGTFHLEIGMDGFTITFHNIDSDEHDSILRPFAAPLAAKLSIDNIGLRSLLREATEEGISHEWMDRANEALANHTDTPPPADG